MIINKDTLIELIREQHDIVCNQKYDKKLPYSYHLDLVQTNALVYSHLIPEAVRRAVEIAAMGHDLIEDARFTYNDCKSRFGEFIADIIYACTELRGKDRAERHGLEYIQGLKENKYALFVKLCDILANVRYSLLTNSSMGNRYKEEWPSFKKELYLKEYKELFEDIESTLNLIK